MAWGPPIVLLIILAISNESFFATKAYHLLPHFLGYGGMFTFNNSFYSTHPPYTSASCPLGYGFLIRKNIWTGLVAIKYKPHS
jgi:hypothetical protein